MNNYMQINKVTRRDIKMNKEQTRTTDKLNANNNSEGE